MQLGYTILYVDDVAKTLAFYEQAFGLSRRFLHESGAYGELETGATTLAFTARQMLQALGKHPQPPQPEAPCFEIALTTPEVSSAVARAIAAGAQLQQAPQTMPWGQTIAYVTDCNGFWVEICTPMA